MIVSQTQESDPLTLAEAAQVLVETNASAAIELGREALMRARAERAAEAEVVALHAISFAQHQLGDPEALRTVRTAIRVGKRYGLARRTALARRRLALDLAVRGSTKAAMRELDLACADLDPLEQARSEVFRIGVIWCAGAVGDALAGTDEAVAVLREAGDAIWEARLLGNRGNLLAERGDVVAAARDVERTRDLFAELGANESVRAAEMLLARIARVRGDLPDCLARLDAIDAADLAPQFAAEHELVRAQALSAAQLWRESLEALGRAESFWERSQREDHGSRLEAVRLTLLAGDPVGARVLARSTQRHFAAQGRMVHAARAAGLGLAAVVAAGHLTPSALRAGRRAADTLAQAGWGTEAQRIQLAVARAAIELGAIRTARAELAACASSRRSGPIADRIEAHHVEALILLAEENPAGAQRAASRGLAVLEEYRAALGAAELRATASSIGAELAALGLRVALSRGEARQVLRWAEALRASALRLTPVTPPDNPELQAALTELRQVGLAISNSERDGHSARALLAQQARAETRVRRLSRHAGGGGVRSRARLSTGELREALGVRALIEYVELDGELTALTLAAGRLRQHALGPAQAVAEPLEWLRFALARLARLDQAAPQRVALAAGAQESAAQLELLLIAPVQDAIGERELVLVPTGALHAVPWAMLPSMRGRPVSVAPSAVAWWSLSTRPPSRRRRVVLVAGPRLRHAAAEVRSVAALHPHASMLSGREATVPAALKLLDGAAVAHFACHGRARADSPLFSCLELADGPLNAYELARLRLAPELIVLSACDLALSAAHPGDELLGFAAALLDMGTRTVIASVVPLPDAGARRITAILHRELAAGASPATALARAQARLAARDVALAGFACLGAG